MKILIIVEALGLIVTQNGYKEPTQRSPVHKSRLEAAPFHTFVVVRSGRIRALCRLRGSKVKCHRPTPSRESSVFRASFLYHGQTATVSGMRL